MPRHPASHFTDAPTIFSGPGLKRRSFLHIGGWSALALGAAPLIAACSSSSSTPSAGGSTTGASPSGSTSSAPNDLGSIAIQLSWIKNVEFAGEFFADDKGYFTAQGFSKVTLSAGGPSGTTAEAAVTTGKALVGLSAINVTAPAVLKGAKLKTIGSTYQKNPFCILSLAKSPIKTPADMKGKKIGVQAGPNTTIFEGLLKANGLTKSDVKIVPVQYDPTILATGGVDGYMAYSTNEPFLLKAKNVDTSFFLFADYKLPLLAETMVVSQDSIDNDKDKLKAYLIAEIKGWTDAVADPAQSAKYAATKYGADQKLEEAEQVLEAKAQNDLVVTADSIKNGLFTVSDELIAANIAALADTGVTVTAEQLFDFSILAEVYKENPDLITAFAKVASSATSSASASPSAS